MDPSLGLFVVADGMGGHRHGEMAAELAISTIKYYLQSSLTHRVTWPFGYNLQLSLEANRLVTGILLANRQIWRRSEDAPECSGMGSTVVALLIDKNRAAIANVGDSRAYLLRVGVLTQLTVDDTWLNAVLKRDMLDKNALLNHPMRNVLTQAAGSQHDLNVHTCAVDLESGDTLLLCTDGIHSVISDDAIACILRSDMPLQGQIALLKETAAGEGAPDNMSCILVRYETDTAEINQ